MEHGTRSMEHKARSALLERMLRVSGFVLYAPCYVLTIPTEMSGLATNFYVLAAAGRRPSPHLTVYRYDRDALEALELSSDAERLRAFQTCFSAARGNVFSLPAKACRYAVRAGQTGEACSQNSRLACVLLQPH